MNREIAAHRREEHGAEARQRPPAPGGRAARLERAHPRRRRGARPGAARRGRRALPEGASRRSTPARPRAASWSPPRWPRCPSRPCIEPPAAVDPDGHGSPRRSRPPRIPRPRCRTHHHHRRGPRRRHGGRGHDRGRAHRHQRARRVHDGAVGLGVRLVERRIGLLFAVFLALLAIAAVRAVWIGTVRAGSLKERAATQQEEDLAVSAKRGTIFDRNGLELAVSEDAITVFANPFLIDNPAKVAGAAGAAARHARGRAAAKALRPRRGLRLPAPEDGRVGRSQGPAAEDRGHRHRRRSRSGATRRAGSPHRCWARWARTTTGLSGLEYSRDEDLRGSGRAAAGS